MKVAVLGGGQLGRMLGLGGIPLGIRFSFLEPATDPPAAQVGQVVCAAYDDGAGLEAVAAGAHVVTYEFENIPVQALRDIEAGVRVFPPTAALEMAQDRLLEKEGFQQIEIATPSYHCIDGLEDVAPALEAVGLPAVLKTRRLGYDGKGQAVVATEEEARRFVAAQTSPLIAEAFVDFDRELSIIAVAGMDGSPRFYPLTENHHRGGILRVSYAPAAQVSSAVQKTAERYASALIDHLGYVGVLAIELFQVGDDLLANEMAPRVHNSGHWTMDGAEVSQFENHIRAVTALPLGVTESTRPTAMINLIGSAPKTEDVLDIPGARIHLYGKSPRPGRKIGHVNIVADDWPVVLEGVRRAVALIGSDVPLPEPSNGR